MLKMRSTARKEMIDGTADGGFTLVETLVALVLLVMIMGSLAGAIIVGMGLTTSAGTKLYESNDARVAATWFGIDVRNGWKVAVPAATPLCPAYPAMSGANDLIDLEMNSAGTSDATWYYGKVGSSHWLERTGCGAGGANPVYVPIAKALSTTQPVVTCGQPNPTTCPNGSAFGYETSVSMTVDEGDGYSYTLTGVSRMGLQGLWATPPALPEAFLMLGTGGVSVEGGAQLNATGNLVADAPSSDTAITIGNGGAISVSGTIGTLAGSTCSGCGTGVSPYPSGIGTLKAVVADPYNSTSYVLTAPSSPSCAPSSNCIFTTSSYTSTATLNPGVYENAVTLGGGATITLNPGTYIFEGGIDIANGATLVGTGGVFIYVGCPSTLPSGQSSCSDTSSAFTVAGGSYVTLTAPSSGTYSGVALFQARNDPTAINVSNGSHTSAVEGVVYAPAAEVVATGQNGSSPMLSTSGLIASSFNASNASIVAVT
jgi:hypothetical protein